MKLNDLLLKEERYWRQHNRINWLKDEDRNMKFFHRKASNRKSNNEFLGLCDSLGCWQDEHRVVEGIIGEYFSSIFTSAKLFSTSINRVTEATPLRVPHEINADLDCPFKAEDVKAAVFCMSPTKALSMMECLPFSSKNFGLSLGWMSHWHLVLMVVVKWGRYIRC